MLLTPPEALLMTQSGPVLALNPAGLDERQCSSSALSRMKCVLYDAKSGYRLNSQIMLLLPLCTTCDRLVDIDEAQARSF